MEVLEEPVEKGPRTYTFRCTNQRCKAKLKAREDEGELKHGGQLDGDCLVFTCPRCSHESWISSSQFDKS